MFLNDFFDAIQGVIDVVAAYLAFLAVVIPQAVAAFFGQLGI